MRRILMTAVMLGALAIMTSGAAQAAPKRGMPVGTQLSSKPGAQILGYSYYWLTVIWNWKHGYRYYND